MICCSGVGFDPVLEDKTLRFELSGIYNVPYDTVRLCTEEGYQGDDETYAVQVIQGIPRVAYSLEDLSYPIRHPRPQLEACGYGYSEAEMVVRLMTAYLNTMTLNMAGMDRNSLPRGLGVIYGDYDPRQEQTMRNDWKAMMRGASNRFGAPLLFAKNKDAGFNWTPLDEFEEMFFARWITLLFAIACAIYGIDPNEINFDSFAVSRSTLSGKDTEEKLTSSRDKGLRPLVHFIEQTYNEDFIRRLTPKYRLEFVGLDPEDEEKKHERIKLSSTVDEMRQQDGKDPMEDENLGNAPTNPALMQVYMVGLQQQMAQDQMDYGFGADGKEDYPTAGGQHAPYDEDGSGKGKPGKPFGGEHLHTLAFDDGGEDAGNPRMPGKPKPMAKAQVGGPVRRKRDFMVVIERGNG